MTSHPSHLPPRSKPAVQLCTTILLCPTCPSSFVRMSFYLSSNDSKTTHAKQVCVQPRPLAVNMALPALCQSCSSAAATMGRTDGPIDGRTNGCERVHKPCSTYSVGSANNTDAMQQLLQPLHYNHLTASFPGQPG